MSVNNIQSSNDVTPVGETAVVYATAIDMDSGERFDFTKIKVIKVAREQLKDQQPVADIMSINNQYAACRLPAGSPITVDVLSATAQVAVTTIPTGFGAIAIDSHLDPMLVPLLRSGCRVDVSAVIENEADRNKVAISRLATGVQVIQSSPVPEQGDLQTSLTILVPEDVLPSIMLAMETGTLHLSLSGSNSDHEMPAGMRITLDAMMAQRESLTVDLIAAASAEQEPAAVIAATDLPPTQTDNQAGNRVESTSPDPASGNISELANDPHDQPGVDLISDVVAISRPIDPSVKSVTGSSVRPAADVYWKMEVMTPQGVTHYQWMKPAGEPTIIIAEEKGTVKTSALPDNDADQRVAVKKLPPR